jgi:hypothetical protein
MKRPASLAAALMVLVGHGRWGRNEYARKRALRLASSPGR